MNKHETRLAAIVTALTLTTTAGPVVETITGSNVISMSVSASAASVSDLTLEDIDRFEQEWRDHQYVLKKGFWANNTATGRRCVKNLQALLVFDFGYDMSIDSVFGSDTKAKVGDAQRRLGVSVDYKVGNQTWNALIKKAREIINARNREQTASVDSKKENAISWMTSREGWTRKDMGYSCDWCTLAISDGLRSAGYSICRSYNPRDLVIDICDNHSMGTFYCFRDKNVQSLKNNGMSSSGLKRVKSVSRSDVTPSRGDIVIYLWKGDTQYNWSHCGIILDYDPIGNKITTIEGNTSGGVMSTRTRSYSSEVVGILRL